MARWRAMVGLVLALAACGGAGGPGSDAEAASSTSGGGGVSADGPTTTMDGVGDMDDADGSHDTHSGGDSSGSVEETFFGMSDDMPLVADIPTIKRGAIPSGTFVVIEQVHPSTSRATLGRTHWVYVQDPGAEEHMGLRVLLRPSDPDLPEGQAVDLEGRLLYDAQGWLLELDSMLEGAAQPPLEPVELRVSTMRSDDGLVYDDALVELSEPAPLVITRRGPVTGTVLAAAVTHTRAVVLVDLRPFHVEVDLPPGTRLSTLRGVAELASGSRPVLLPRDTDDVVVAR